MAVLYHQILRATALRRNALVGVLPADIEAAYISAPLLAVDIDSADFPFDSLIDDILFCAGDLVAACCADGTHPQAVKFRSYVELAHGAVIPATDNAGKSRVGPLGDVYDHANTRRLTEQTPQMIQMRRDNPGNLWSLDADNYYIDPRNGRIDHTLAGNARLTCWVWDAAAERAKIVANTAMTLPEDWAEALVCGACSLGVRDDSGQGQAAIYRQYYADAKAQLAAGRMLSPASDYRMKEAQA